MTIVSQPGVTFMLLGNLTELTGWNPMENLNRWATSIVRFSFEITLLLAFFAPSGRFASICSRCKCVSPTQPR
jgi:hypothetical protein